MKFQFKVFLLLFLIVTTGKIFSQTPGMIFDPATGAGISVLDPDGNGWVSVSPSGFVTNDQSESEIPFLSMIFPMPEPDSDLGPGPDCGFTDFVQQQVGVEDAGQYYLSPANNLLFRLRMSSALSNSKSYSILIDTDQKFGSTGPNADGNYQPGNPGFEIEIVLATNFGVYIYNVDGTSSPGLPVVSYNGHTNYQKSIALSDECTDPDYFLDFFVDFDDLMTAPFNLLTTTPLRMVLIDNMAANKSTINNSSSASDLGGMDDCGGNFIACMDDIIDNYTPCAVGAQCPDRSVCPSITGTLTNGATSVSGTSTEPNGTTIRVYKNDNVIGTTTVTGGAWSLTGISPALATGNIIGASAQASGEGESVYNCGLVIVTNCPGAPDAAPVISSATGKNICGTGLVGYDIKTYYPSGVLYPANPSTSAYLPVPTGGSWVWKCTGNTGGCNSGSGVDCISEGGYSVYQVSTNGCASYPAFTCVSIGGGYSPGTTPTPTIVSSTVYTGSTSVQVTVTNNAAPAPQTGYIYLYVNNAFYAVSNQISGTGTFAVSCAALPAGSSVTARYIQSGASGDHECFSLASGAVTIYTNATPPVVTGTYCVTAPVTSVSGTSTDPAGTIIQVYENGAVEGATTTVLSNGTWTASSGISIAIGSTITAKAQIGAGPLSGVSNSIEVTTKSTNAININLTTITEGDASVSGTGSNNDVIKLYIDGVQIGNTPTVAGGVWTVSGLGTYDLYTGGIVTATATTPGKCESNPSGSRTVVCSMPLTTLTVDPASEIICEGSIIVDATVYSSQSGIIYQFVDGSNNPSGASKLGTGGNITLTSGVLTANTTLYVKALKIPVGSCTSTLTDNIPVTVKAMPTTSLTVATTSPVCAGTSVNVQVQLSQLGFNYQLRNDADDSSIGSPVAGTGGTINLPTGNLYSTTTYNILATGTAPTYCSAQLATTPTITVNTFPDIATVSNNSRCGTGTVNLGATASSGTINWYQVATGGVSLGTGVSYTTGSISETTTFYVDATDGGCTTASRTPVVATIYDIPTISLVYNNSNCGTGTVSLGASATEGTINWYANLSGGASLSTGTSYTTASIATTTSYFVDATANGCTTTSRTPVLATIYTIPTVTSVTTGSRCGTGTVSLSATPSSGSIEWYAASSGGTSLGSGNSYNTGSISSTTTYYVEALENGCNTAARTPVTAIVYAIPTGNITATSPICAGVNTTLDISLTGTPNWTVKFSDGTTTTTVNNINSSPYSRTETPGSNTTYTLTEISDANCTNTSP